MARRDVLTELTLRKLKPGDAGRYVNDGGALRGLVRINAAGALEVMFRLRYRHEGKARAWHCGTWPGDRLAAIRAERERAAKLVKAGRCPTEEAKREREAEAARRAAEAARLTVRRLFEKWRELYLARERKDGGAELARIFERDVFPILGERAAEAVCRADVAELLDKILARGARRLSVLVLSSLRQMYRYAIGREWVSLDPTLGLAKGDYGGAGTERERILDAGELRQLAQRLPASGLPERVQRALWILLATAARVGELSRARWPDLDLEAGTWRIPAEHAKNGREHLVHLSDFARVHFAALPRIEGCAYVLAGRAKPAQPEAREHIELKAIARAVKDRQRAAPLKNRAKLGAGHKKSASLLLGGGAWTPHDLRRTAATIMGELGVRPDVIERCLNHSEERKVRRVYQRSELLAERAQAFALLGDYLDRVTRGDASNVIELRRAAS